MSDRILRPPEVRRALGNISNSTLYLWVKQRKLPAPSKIVPGGRASGWNESTINAVVAGMVERNKAA